MNKHFFYKLPFDKFRRGLSLLLIALFVLSSCQPPQLAQAPRLNPSAVPPSPVSNRHRKLDTVVNNKIIFRSPADFKTQDYPDRGTWIDLSAADFSLSLNYSTTDAGQPGGDSLSPSSSLKQSNYPPFANIGFSDYIVHPVTKRTFPTRMTLGFVGYFADPPVGEIALDPLIGLNNTIKQHDRSVHLEFTLHSSDGLTYQPVPIQRSGSMNMTYIDGFAFKSFDDQGNYTLCQRTATFNGLQSLQPSGELHVSDGKKVSGQLRFSFAGTSDFYHHNYLQYCNKRYSTPSTVTGTFTLIAPVLYVPENAVEASESFISPKNRDNQFDVTQLKVHTTSSNAWQIAVTGNKPGPLIGGYPSQGETCSWQLSGSGANSSGVEWNGTCQDGTYMADGVYYPTLSFTGSDQVTAAEVQIDNTPPEVRNLTSTLENGNTRFSLEVTDPTVNEVASGLDELKADDLRVTAGEQVLAVHNFEKTPLLPLRNAYQLSFTVVGDHTAGVSLQVPDKVKNRSGTTTDPGICLSTAEVQALANDYQSLADQVQSVLDELEAIDAFDNQGFSIKGNYPCFTDGIGNAQCASMNFYQFAEDVGEVALQLSALQQQEYFAQLDAFKAKMDAYYGLAGDVALAFILPEIAVEYAIALETKLLIEGFKALTPFVRAQLLANPTTRKLLQTALYGAKKYLIDLPSLALNQTQPYGQLCANGPSLNALNSLRDPELAAGVAKMSPNDIVNGVSGIVGKGRPARLSRSQKAFATTLNKVYNVDKSNSLLHKVGTPQNPRTFMVTETKITGQPTKGGYAISEGDDLKFQPKKGELKDLKQHEKFEPSDLPTDNPPLEILGNASDTEAKFLVDLSEQLDTYDANGNRVRNANVSGEITMEITRFPCDRCQKTIESFQRRYPNIKINIGYIP